MKDLGRYLRLQKRVELEKFNASLHGDTKRLLDLLKKYSFLKEIFLKIFVFYVRGLEKYLI